MRNVFILISFCLGLCVSTLAQSKPRIFNGEISRQASWIVSISHKEKNNLSARHFCGGVVIAPSWILTAAHCAEADFNQPNVLQVSYGNNDLTRASIVGVDGMILEDRYNLITSEYDLALLHLESPIPVTPLEIYSGEEELLSGTPATVYGWGLTELTINSNIPETILRSVEIPVISQDICKKQLKDLYNSDSMLCAGVLSSAPNKYDGKDNCYGDSGGPLVTEINGKPELIGIVSWGIDCASDKGYGVYANIPKLKTWLNEAHTIPSYAIDAPSIHGPALVGRSLTCNPDLIAGNSLTNIKYRWLDAKTSSVVAKSKRLRINASLSKRKLVCEVQLISGKVSTYAYSKPTKAIKPAIKIIKSRLKLA